MLSRLLTLLLVAGSLAILSTPAARAQEPSPSHLAVAREVVGITGAATSADEIIPALIQDIKQQNVTRPDLTKDLDEVLKNLAPELELQRQQAINITARAYAKWLTEPELREVVAFYKTPTGAKYAKVQSDVVDDAVKGLGDWSQQAAEYVMVRTRVEMQKRGHQLQ